MIIKNVELMGRGQASEQASLVMFISYLRLHLINLSLFGGR